MLIQKIKKVKLMTTRLFAGMLGIVLAISFLGTALAEEENTSITDLRIDITNANFVAPSPEKENLNEEWVEITNKGSSDVNLAGWTLNDAQNHIYTFPDFVLAAGAKVVVRTGVGDDSAGDLFWSRSSSIWNNSGDLAQLKDLVGSVVSQYPEEENGA